MAEDKIKELFTDAEIFMKTEFLEEEIAEIEEEINNTKTSKNAYDWVTKGKPHTRLANRKIKLRDLKNQQFIFKSKETCKIGSGKNTSIVPRFNLDLKGVTFSDHGSSGIGSLIF